MKSCYSPIQLPFTSSPLFVHSVSVDFAVQLPKSVHTAFLSSSNARCLRFGEGLCPAADRPLVDVVPRLSCESPAIPLQLLPDSLLIPFALGERRRLGARRFLLVSSPVRGYWPQPASQG